MTSTIVAAAILAALLLAVPSTGATPAADSPAAVTTPAPGDLYGNGPPG